MAKSNSIFIESRLSQLPTSLRSVILISAVLSVVYFIMSIQTSEFTSILNIVLGFIFLVVALGLYALFPPMRLIAIIFYLVGIITGLYTLGTSITDLSLILNGSASSLTQTLVLIFSGFLIPIIEMYLFILMRNDQVKKYFDHPELLENPIYNKNTEDMDRKYKSLDVLDKKN